MHFWKEIKSLHVILKKIFTVRSKTIRIDIVNTIKKPINTGVMVDMFWKIYKTFPCLMEKMTAETENFILRQVLYKNNGITEGLQNYIYALIFASF